ncbi:type I restriction endonuclease subunit R [Planktothrix agardhii]|uniref:type I restriction endonuclease subunit R n=1 Tax=Planktothrix agardhii TaxID=1160 RepID=UPI001D0ABF14|nr:DEAD/DEAH box helicase family protein [Planktothrix agardhii]MCB8750930.1 DEAD/DEAH box helicase family protein [Planktothrix agardhii 1810]MCF3606723.1 DEAD/DEAH box helicase family protein [Planktothrix agardhii 1033]
MMIGSHIETAFEQVIEDYLLTQGYVKTITPFDKTRAIFPEIAIAFIRQTQPKEWAKLEALHGENTANQIITDLCKWMDTYGSLHTLRHGFKCYGRTLRIAYFKAAHSLNIDLETRYNANQLGITRQLQYSDRNRNELDITLSLNGIPLITIELKNPLTGQTVEQGKQQYRQDRDPHEIIFEFKRRTLVHFTVDTEEVWMTTRLAGKATHFLPFNKGYNNGAGNPPDPQGQTYRTAYFWEEVLQRDSLLDLLAQFLHLQIEEKYDNQGRKFKKESMIFPRYHQLQAVRQLIEATQLEGIGQNYLIEHSAGSGKSNTIAWLTHRLSSLHNKQNQRIFDSVIVISDRRILDQQLQDTIYQFEHRQGVIQKIDKDSKQLAQALESAVPIIITTLQKFPFVTRQLLKLAEERNEQGRGLLPTRRCAVIIDEAHSSQSGDTATELKGVLGGEALHQKAREMAEEEGLEHLEEMFLSMAKRSHQDNLSFFAFTATPKHKTLKFFGRQGEAFHRYTMRQAIEESFIMDVLKHYTTYKAYFKLIKDCSDDPHVERKKAAKALARFMRLHPHNISQKTEIMVEHFNHFTRHKIGGKAKAMVVTGSRLEAVRYKQSFDKYIKEKGYPIKTLVAFSGIVTDDKISEKTYTEEEMNQGIREKELPEKFATNDYQVLLVAEKYQTGFDQPLLHTMYVDKRLAGIQAVQTLSRLNRTHPQKEDTFILDFVNQPEEIREAFQQFYEGAELGQEAEPAQLYQLKSQLDASGIYLSEEIKRFCAIYFKPKQRQSPADHQGMNAVLDPAVDRFRALYEQNIEEAELWRRKLTAFRNLYSFLSQIIPYQDSDLEQIYIFLRHLSPKLLRHSNEDQYDFDSDIQLEYYRLQKISEGSIHLEKAKKSPLDGPKAVGTAILRENSVKLSQLIDLLNSRFGTDFNQADQLFFDQIVEAAANSEELQQAAQVNSPDKFTLLFNKIVESLFIERVDQNEAIFARYMNDNDFKQFVSNWLVSQVYKRLQ